MLMRENVNKDICKDLPIRNFQPGKKSRRSCGQVLVQNSRNKVNVAKTKINTFAPILVLVLATLKALLLQLNGMLMMWKLQQAMQDDYMPSTPPQFIPLSSQYPNYSVLIAKFPGCLLRSHLEKLRPLEPALILL